MREGTRVLDMPWQAPLSGHFGKPYGDFIVGAASSRTGTETNNRG
jgi:hypothetical protein